MSAICGTHLGETNAPASTAGRPASASRSISADLGRERHRRGSFCRPSRGPTSTMVTRAGRCEQLALMPRLRRLEVEQLDALRDLVAPRAAHRLDLPSAAPRRVCSIFIASSTSSGCALRDRVAGPPTSSGRPCPASAP